jgi:drug/metabolite transporter (DMT)-like permease
MDHRGLAFCVLSAVLFGTTAVFVDRADHAGVGLVALLAARFALATGVLAVAAVATPGAAPVRPNAAGARAFLLGAGLASVQSTLLVVAILRLGPALGVLLHYAYPAAVAGVSVALGRERARGRLVAVVALATAGVALVLAGDGDVRRLDPVGVAAGLGSAALYSGWMLAASAVGRPLAPVTFATLVSGGMATAFGVAAVVLGTSFGFGAAGWGWLVALAIISTAIPLIAFVIGVARVGPATASVASTVEPVTTVALAWLVLGQSLAPAQTLGASLVAAGVIVLALRVERRREPRFTSNARGWRLPWSEVGDPGFEPGTSALSERRSNRLS